MTGTSDNARSTRDDTEVAPPQVDYRRLFEHTADAVLVVDREGRYIDANPAASELTGYTRAEILRMRVGDLAVKPDRRYSAERFELLREQGRTRSNRVVQRKDGTLVPVEVRATALPNGTFQTTIRDITEAVKAQNELDSSLDAYSTLMDLCHASVISCGPDGRIRSWNVAARDLFGYSAEEAVGRPVTMLIPPRLLEAHVEGYARHVDKTDRKRFARTFQAEALCKDDSEVPIEISVAVDLQGDDRIFTAVVRDVTEQRDLVERLNDALQRLQFHVERMPLAYIVWDVDFKVVEWNPAAERIFGYTKVEAMHRHAYELIVPPEVVPAVDLVWEDLLGGRTNPHKINPNVRKDGSRLLCEWFNTSLRDSAGRVRGVASMAMDVSEREAVAARIRDAQKLESLGVLAGGFAHDVNSSLTVILGNVSLLRAIGGQSPRALESIDLIEAAGARASELVKHLLTYARTGRHNPHPTDINAVIRDTLSLVQSSIGKDHELELRLCEPLPTVMADASQVEQILLNLCLNAKQAMPRPGTIVLETRTTDLTPADLRKCVPYDTSPGRFVEIVVRDTGVGMDADTISRMFDPFFTTKAQGHGLGMAAVLGILRQHGAVALIESRPGKGTSVHVYFPATRDAPETDAARRETPSR
ncbi:MAG: PAS domain S-box protein [Planctomycetes bacterium]|nr:PAS domain S-box protein [Planctomycetota bacterium]